MPTGDAYSSGHLVPSLWDLHMFYLLRPILFRTCRYFTGLCSSNIPRYFLDFAYSSVKRLTILSDSTHCRKPVPSRSTTNIRFFLPVCLTSHTAGSPYHSVVQQTSGSSYQFVRHHTLQEARTIP